MSTFTESDHPIPDQIARNVVLCFDGTGDWVGFDRTNVAQIFSKLVRDETQLTFYDGGVGTLASPQALTGLQRTTLKLIDLGVATGLREKVLNGYNFLVRNYQPGDRIFMFGFSRGAYTARLVAAMIHNFGLVRPEHEVISQYLWQTLESIPIDEGEMTIGVFKRTANGIKRDFSRRGVEIHFMGLFDTVSSVGVLRRFNVYPNTDKNPSIARVCHAVSIDEQRNAFPEALFHPRQRGLTEVWFPGVHRDVGGGLPEGRRRIADEALAWISKEATDNGLRLVEPLLAHAEEIPVPNYPKYDPYVFLGLYPMKMFVKRVTGFRFIWPNFRHLRTIPEDALVHEIAFTLKNQGHYAPANFPLEPRIFPEQAEVPGSLRYLLRERKFSPADFIGTLLGATLLLLIWNDAENSPLGESWPAIFGKVTAGHLASILFIAFFLGQFAGQRITERLPKALRPRPEGLLPGAGVIVGLFVAFEALQHHWQALGWCGGAGALIALASQSPGLPTLQSDRTLPSVLWASIGTGLFYGGVNRFLPSEIGIFPSAIFFIALILVAVVFDVVSDRLTQEAGSDDDREARRSDRPEPPARAIVSERSSPIYQREEESQ